MKQVPYTIIFFLTIFLQPLKMAAQNVILPVSELSHPSLLNSDSTFLVLKEKMEDRQLRGDENGQAICLQQMGQILYHLGSYTQAMDYLLQADKIFRSLQKTDLLASNLNLLGTIFYYNQQPKQARLQFQEALAIHQRENNHAGMAETYGLIGHMYEKQLDYDSAFLFQQKAIGFAKKAKDTAVLAKIYENLGSIFEDKSNYDSARYYFLLSRDAYQASGKMLEQIEVINNLGDVWSKSGNFKRGMLYANQAASMALMTGEKYQLQSAYRDIAQNFVGLKIFDSAYYYLEKSRHLVQSIYSLENSYQISVLQTLYETEKKNGEIVHLNASRRTNRLLNVTILIVMVLLAMLSLLIISRQKTEKGLLASELKRQQLEEYSLKEQLEIKGSQLSAHILHLIQKNEVMEEIKQGLTAVIKDEKRDQKKQVRQLLQKISLNFSKDAYWEEFRHHFDKVHPSFMKNLQIQFPALTPGELRLLALMKMNLASGDIATLLGVSPDSLRVLRYRTKKKLLLTQEESLSGFVCSL